MTAVCMYVCTYLCVHACICMHVCASLENCEDMYFVHLFWRYLNNQTLSDMNGQFGEISFIQILHISCMRINIAVYQYEYSMQSL